ncbi:fibronectin type III and SPRY domain-containing protein 2 isoform X3 [Prionailurus viverrinus]|uniref:fibronectin type III and SPRY domain-containing protein 2 isoform X3 n=1 Tax=Prionailurus viverrinus TaxID=61388 RepID=UPI001FF5AF0A|nr:fibronectin type III and SPRY domain-containing protein 2 isoform X3 [Prionailurus viverrinus]
MRPRTPTRRRACEELCGCRGAMDGEAGGAPEVHRSPAPGDFHFCPTDLYDSEGRLRLFPEEHTRTGRQVPAEMTSEPGGAAPGKAQSDLEEEVQELVDLYALGGGGEWGAELVHGSAPRVEVSEPRLHLPAAGAQWDWRLGAEAEDPGCLGWGAAGRDLREAYRYAHGRASEEYECYVIPEEEDEDEAALVFCVTCKAPVRAREVSDAHGEHEVTPLSKALESAKDEIHKNMFKLEKQIIEMENFANHLEEVFITVEENFGRQEQNFESHFNEILETLAQKYEEKIQALGEKKKAKLEALYGQLVSCGENLDTCKELMETIEEMCHEEKVDFIKDAVAMADRLGKFLNTETDVEISAQPDFEDQTLDFSDVEQLMGSINTIPAPSAPVINPQAPNSATGSSVRVCWSLYSDDTVESYLLSYRPVHDGSPGKDQAEFTMTVKETYCSVRNLVPNTQYEFWVTAQNRAGRSPASERAMYMTAPSPPVIKSKEIRSCEEAALICWESGNLNPVDSYTVELTQAESPEASGVTESVVGIPTREALVQLQPRQRYTIYVRALSVGGPSARSDPVTVYTTGRPEACRPGPGWPRRLVAHTGCTPPSGGCLYEIPRRGCRLCSSPFLLSAQASPTHRPSLDPAAQPLPRPCLAPAGARIPRSSAFPLSLAVIRTTVTHPVQTLHEQRRHRKLCMHPLSWHCLALLALLALWVCALSQHTGGR